MNPELKPKWIEALRSGKYEQCRYELKTDRYGEGFTYCCLGVLRDLIDPDSCQSCAGVFLIESHAKLARITWDQQETLAKMNDQGKSFEEIADYIEKNL